MVTGILSFNSLFCFLLTFIAQVTLEGRKIRVGEGGEEKRKILVKFSNWVKNIPITQCSPYCYQPSWTIYPSEIHYQYCGAP